MCSFIKKSKMLMISFFVLSFLALFVSYIIENQVNNTRLGSEEAVTFTCYSEQDNVINEVIFKLGSNYTVVRDDDHEGVKGIYATKDIEIKPDLIYGRFFNAKDFNTQKNCVVIGKNYLPYVIEEYGLISYKIDDKKYEVIGIMGSNEGKTEYDDLIYANLDALIRNNPKYSNGTFILEGKKGNNLFDKLSDICKSKNIEINKITDTKQIEYNRKMDFEKCKIGVVIIVFIFIFGITRVWVEGLQKEIALRRAIGASKKQIIKSIILSFNLFGIIPYFVGIGAFALFSYLLCGHVHFYMETINYVLFVSIISAFTAISISIIEVMKNKLSEVLG